MFHRGMNGDIFIQINLNKKLIYNKINIYNMVKINMRHIRRFNENNEMNVHNSIFGKNKFKINQESRIENFKKEFKRTVEYNEDEFEQGDEPSMTDILSEVGDLCNKYEINQKDLKKLIDNGDDIDGILKDLYEFGHEEGENASDLESKIINIIKSETYTRDVKYTDDKEVDSESVVDAAKSIINLLKKEGYIK